MYFSFDPNHKLGHIDLNDSVCFSFFECLMHSPNAQCILTDITVSNFKNKNEIKIPTGRPFRSVHQADNVFSCQNYLGEQVNASVFFR